MVKNKDTMGDVHKSVMWLTGIAHALPLNASLLEKWFYGPRKYFIQSKFIIFLDSNITAFFLWSMEIFSMMRVKLWNNFFLVLRISLSLSGYTPCFPSYLFFSYYYSDCMNQHLSRNHCIYLSLARSVTRSFRATIITSSYTPSCTAVSHSFNFALTIK